MEYYKTKRDFKKSKQDLIIELNSYYRITILKSPHLPNTPVVPNKKMFLAVAFFFKVFWRSIFCFIAKLSTVNTVCKIGMYLIDVTGD